MNIPVPPNHGPPDHGPFEGVPMGDQYMDDIQIIDPLDDRDMRGGSRNKAKNNKNNNDKDTTTTTSPSKHYEGCVLERLKPRPGETSSWRRCGRRWLPFSQDELVKLVKKHWQVTGNKSPDPDFKRLSGDKQGIINRVIDEKILNEKSKTAEWTLVDVQSIERRSGWTKEVVRLQIVIKRTDKGNDKNGYAATSTQSYTTEDIIDLAVPLKKKKANDKVKVKNNNGGARNSGNFDPLDDPMNMGFGPNDLPPQRDNRMPEYDDRQWDPPGPNHPPPQVPFPPEWQPPQHPPPQDPFDIHQQFPPDPRASFPGPGGARDFGIQNPFNPLPHVADPRQFDEPFDNRDYIHPHPIGRARTRSADRDRHHDDRSRSRRRHSHARRPSHSRRRRDDSVEDVRYKFDRMYRDDRDSNSSNYDEHSMWSRSEGRHSRSPDTSVYSDEYPPRNRSKPYHRDSDPRPRYRSTRYRDAQLAEIEPAYTTYRRDNDDRDRRYSGRRRDRRPGLPHAITYDAYDDYPQGRAAEPRFLPAPPSMQRRNTDVFGDKRGDYFDGEFQRSWGRQPVDRESDAFEAGVRAERRRGAAYYP